MKPSVTHRISGTLTLFASLLLFMGCGRSTDKSDTRAASTKAPLPPDVVVDVDGKSLDREQADMETRYRLRTLARNVPPEQRAQLEQEIRRRVTEQFVAKTLLAREAEKQGFKATDEEIDQAYERVRSQLPPGQTLEDMIRASPARARKMRQDMVNGIVINKLLESLPKDALTVSQAEMDNFYAGVRRARHILIEIEENALPETRAQLREMLEKLRQQIVHGQLAFEEAAARHSNCPSAQKGGYLGHFPKGKMVPEFDRAAFSQTVGEIGPIVETPFGYHIIQVMENEIEDSGPLAKENVRRELLRTKQAANVDAFVESLKKNASIRYAPDYGGRKAADDTAAVPPAAP